MKSILTAVALSALGLAAISGCTIESGGDDSVSHKFGSDYFGAGGVLNIIDPIDGDAFLAGGNVSIASEIEGDLIAAGGDVSVGGNIGDDVYVAGGDVNVDAIVSGNVRIAGGDINVGPATAIGGNVALTAVASSSRAARRVTCRRPARMCGSTARSRATSGSMRRTSRSVPRRGFRAR
jgi:hypothetical protein